MSLYGLPESVRELLKLERFSDREFSVKEFIEQLSSSQSHAVTDDRLDPKPYIRAFEAVANELERLRGVTTRSEEDESKKVEKLGQARNWDIIDLADHIEACAEEAKELDDEISVVQHTTAPLGEQIERKIGEIKQAQLSQQLVSCYISFVERGSAPELTKLWTSSLANDRRRCASIVGQLQSLSHKIGAVNSRPTIVEDIDKYAEQLEMEMVATFQESYQIFDLSGMQEIAEILYDYNGGASIVQAYVNQHDFFMQVDKLDTEQGAVGPQLSDTESDYAEFRQAVKDIVQEVTEVAVNETDVVVKVFPKPAQVLSVFMQRTFAQRLQGMVARFMSEAEQQSNLAEVRVLGVCCKSLSDMVDQLKDAWQRLEESAELAAMLDTNYNDTLGMFLESYFDTEILALREIIMNVFEEQARPEEQTGAFAEPLSPTSEEGFMKSWRPRFRSGSPSASPAAPLGIADEEEHLITALQRVLSSFAEAVAREQILSPRRNARHDAVEIFNLLITEVGGAHINPAIDGALHRSHADSKTPESYSWLLAIRTVTRALGLLSAFVKTAVFALIRGEEGARSSMATTLNQYVSSVQDHCSDLVDQAAHVVHIRTLATLGRQKRKDLSQIDGPESPGPSSTGMEIAAELRALGAVAEQALSPENLRRLLLDVTSTLQEDIGQHLARITISMAGGRVLAADAALYEAIIVQEWGLSDAADELATMRVVTRLFAVQPTLLMSLLRDSHLMRLKASTVRSYVVQRSDYQSENLQILFMRHKVGY